MFSQGRLTFHAYYTIYTNLLTVLAILYKKIRKSCTAYIRNLLKESRFEARQERVVKSTYEAAENLHCVAWRS